MDPHHRRTDAADPTGTRLTGTFQDITESKQAEETLRVQARTDPLTMLLNRDAVLEELEARLDDPSQSGVAVLYIDLDRFKVVNDVLGHAAGDQVIASAARRIQRAVATEGLIARFGGDEFLVVCADRRRRRTSATPRRRDPRRLRRQLPHGRRRIHASPRASASRARPNTAIARKC